VWLNKDSSAATATDDDDGDDENDDKDDGDRYCNISIFEHSQYIRVYYNTYRGPF
jgi:hypothetical protein